MADEKKVEVTLKFGLDKSGADQVKQGEQAVADGLKKIEKSAQNAERAIGELRDRGEKLKQLGGTLALPAAGFIAGVGALAKAYADKVAGADATSNAWLAAMEKIEQSQTRIGKSAADALLPVLEKAADITVSIADFLEKNPDALKVALAVAGGAFATGSALNMVGTGMQTIATLQSLGVLGAGGAGGLLSGAGGAISAGVGGLISSGAAAAGGAALGGVAAGGMLYDYGARNWGWGGGANLGQFASVGAYSLGNLLGGEQTAKDWFTAVSGMTGAVDKNTQAALENANAQGKAAAAAAKAPEHVILAATLAKGQELYTRYQAQLAAADAELAAGTSAENASYGAARQAKVGAYNADSAQADADWADQQAKMKRDFDRQAERDAADYRDRQQQAQRDFYANELEADKQHKKDMQLMAFQFAGTEARSEQAYYARRTEAAEKYGVEVARMEEDHQKQMRRMQADGAAEIDDLARSRDALGLVKAMRRQETERQRAEEDYQTEAARKNADFAAQMADEAKHFTEERAQRLEDYAQRVKDAESNFKDEKEKRKEAFDQSNKDADEQYKKAREQAKADYALQWLDANEANNKQAIQRSQQHQAELNQLDQNHRDTLAKLQTQANEKKTQLKNDLVEALNALDPYLTGQQQKVQAQLEKNAQEFQKFLDGMKNQMNGGAGYMAPTTTPAATAPSGGGNKRRAEGGYAGFGRYFLGERGREFVLNAPATLAAERLLGGGLSQERVVRGLSGGASVNLGGITVNGMDAEGTARLASRMVYEQVKAGIQKTRAQRQGAGAV